MPQSLTNVALHIVFSVKNRERYLDDEIRERFHAYVIGVHENLGCPVIEVNSEPDHVHILCNLARTVSIADLMESAMSGIEHRAVSPFQGLNFYHHPQGLPLRSCSLGCQLSHLWRFGT